MDTGSSEKAQETGQVAGLLKRIVGCRSNNVRKHLDLFSGIGGFALAAEWVGGFETIAF